MGNAATTCFEHVMPPPGPPSHATRDGAALLVSMTLEQIETVCADGDLLLCRELVYNPHIMTTLNPVVVNGIATAAVSGNFSTKRRDLPAWTSCGLLVRHHASLHVVEATAAGIRVTPLKHKVHSMKSVALNRFAIRRFQPSNDDALPALRRHLSFLAARSPCPWKDAIVCENTGVRSIITRVLELVRWSVAPLTAAELDMVRFAFNKHDVECLGWLFLEDLPKVVAEIDDMDLFKHHATWQGSIASSLREVDPTKFTAATLVAAAQSISRQHISSEYDVTLYSSTALVASLFEAVEVIERLKMDPSMPALVPLVFAEATGATRRLELRPDKASLAKEIHILPPKTAHPDDDADTSLAMILRRSWQSWQST